MVAALLCTAASVASAQQAFKTPDEAASALASAAKTGDMRALDTVLGPDGEDIVSSGDEVADAASVRNLLRPMMRTIRSKWMALTKLSW